jgi:DNA replication protein
MIKMSENLKIKPKELLRMINSLVEKDYLKLDVIKDECNAGEYFNLDGIYRKITFNIIDKEEKKENVSLTIYDEFEQAFKRPLTPMEFQIIDAWKEVGYNTEIIILALKEATYNGAYSVAYIDKVLSAWDKKGIRTADDVEKNKQEFRNKKNEPAELEEEYDWLNE